MYMHIRLDSLLWVTYLCHRMSCKCCIVVFKTTSYFNCLLIRHVQFLNSRRRCLCMSRLTVLQWKILVCSCNIRFARRTRVMGRLWLWSSSLLARFTYKVSVAPWLNMFRLGPWLSGTLFHTTHRQVLQIHRRDKNVSTTHISLYKCGNASEIRTFSLKYFLANHREKRLCYSSVFGCVFTVRSVVSVVMPCSFTCEYQRHGDAWNLKTSVTIASSPEDRNHSSGDWSPAFRQGGQSWIPGLSVRYLWRKKCRWQRFFSANCNYPLSVSFHLRSVLIHSSTTDAWKLRQIKQLCLCSLIS